MAYRPDDLILCSTNNGTERLNQDLKYDELKGLKQSSLSQVLVILVSSFIPKHYKNYIEFNVRYGDGCKRYASGIPYFLKNRLKKIVEVLLEKMCRAVQKAEINRLDQHAFKVNHNEECTGIRIRKEYEVFLGNESKFCSCSCHDFRGYRMLCKHFLTIFDSNLAKFDDLSPLFLNHPYVILDHSMFGNNNEIDSPSCKDETLATKWWKNLIN